MQYLSKLIFIRKIQDDRICEKVNILYEIFQFLSVRLRFTDVNIKFLLNVYKEN